jgi:putative transposase
MLSRSVSMAWLMPQKFKTCRRYNEAGHAHAITFCCFRRLELFSRARCCRWLVEAIELARRRHEFDLWAYVFMPEHVHLLIWPRGEIYSIRKILGTIKLPVTRRALSFVRERAPSFLQSMTDRQPNGDCHYRFWQGGGGYDRNLTEPSTIFSEIDYIHQNPVQRGLCPSAGDWMWSSAADYLGLRHGPLDLNLNSLPRTSEG